MERERGGVVVQGRRARQGDAGRKGTKRSERANRRWGKERIRDAPQSITQSLPGDARARRLIPLPSLITPTFLLIAGSFFFLLRDFLLAEEEEGEGLLVMEAARSGERRL